MNGYPSLLAFAHGGGVYTGRDPGFSPMDCRCRSMPASWSRPTNKLIASFRADRMPLVIVEADWVK
jgi:hypothetical protein